MPDFLNRQSADLPAGFWERIDTAVAEAARQQLVGRRILPMEGPFGIGLKMVTRRAEELCAPRTPQGDGGTCISVAGGLPVPLIYHDFTLGVRDIEAHARFGQPIDLTPAVRAAASVAAREEQLIFYGETSVGLTGLANSSGTLQSEVGDWSREAQAIEDIIRAVTLLDRQGPKGPYALALSPDLYNALFHKYQDSDLLRIEHLRSLIREGIYKTSVLEERTGVLLITASEVARLVLGEDLSVGYRFIEGMFHRFIVFESLVAEVIRPEGICVLRANNHR